MFEELQGRLSGEDLDSMKALFISELKDLVSAEGQTVDVYPSLRDGTETESLQAAFDQFRLATKERLATLRTILSAMDAEENGVKCIGMEGIVKEAKKLLGTKGHALVKDAALIGSVQRMKHYEIAAYGGVMTYAGLLGDSSAFESLQRALGDVRHEDEELTALAVEGVNIMAPRR